MTRRPSFKQGTGKAIAVVVALLGGALPCAQAEIYRFEQGGYTDGASLVVTIEGPSGLIPERIWGGITRIDAAFTGNGEMPAFSFSSRNENGGAVAIFDGLADDLTLGNTEGDGIYITMPPDEHQMGVAAFFTPDGGKAAMTTVLMYNQPLPDGTVMGLNDMTSAPMRLTSPVPEPAAIAMMAVGLTGLVALARRPKRPYLDRG